MEGAGVPAGVKDPVRRYKEDCSGLRRLKDNSAFIQVLSDQDLPEDPVVFGIGEKSASAPYIFLDDMNTSGDNYPDLPGRVIRCRDDLVFLIAFLSAPQTVDEGLAVSQRNAAKHRMRLKRMDQKVTNKK